MKNNDKNDSDEFTKCEYWSRAIVCVVEEEHRQNSGPMELAQNITFKARTKKLSSLIVIELILSINGVRV